MITVNGNLKIIGVGNPWRGDDAAGLWVARQLRDRLPPRFVVDECDGDLTRLLDLWRGCDRVLLVDVVDSGAAPGTLHRIAASDAQLLRGRHVSCHSTGLAEILGLGRALHLLPEDWLIYAIEGKNYTFGAPISPEVKAGAEGAVAAILAEMESGAKAARHA